LDPQTTFEGNPGDSRATAAAQIHADRYHAAHLLGDLKDPRAVPILIPLLTDKEVNYIVPWSLAQIGDKRAVMPLIRTLADPDPSIRVLAIYALEKLGAKDALPALYRLRDDNEKSHFGDLMSVADAAKAAVAKLDGH
jgi:HEAT repeat protein